MQLPDIEKTAAKVHAEWVKTKIASGTTTRILDTTGEELLVPYDQLTDIAKELDRTTVRTVYSAIIEAAEDEK